MATYISYTPTGVIAKAMFNFDASGIADYTLSGVVRVSVSDDFTFGESPLLYTSGSTEVVWTPQMTANIQDTLAIYSQFVNIPFQWVGDFDTSPPGFDSTPNPRDVGQANLSDININWVYRPDEPTIAGISGGNSDSLFLNYTGAAGDIFLNQASFSDQTLGLGTQARETLMHELGHSLGLSHPHTDPDNLLGSITADFSATKDLGFNQLGFRTNSGADMSKGYFTIMSYDQQPSVAITPMILDVIALQQAYGEGAGTSGSGNDTIAAGTAGYRTYFDKGGLDTVDLASYTSGAYLHMGTKIIGAAHSVGVAMSIADANNVNLGGNPSSLRWFYGEYENAKGSSGNDRIIGNTLSNLIDGGAGQDVLMGGEGNDTLIGGTENDLMTGGTGKDALAGGDGNDVLVGGGGNDAIDGGLGTDTVSLRGTPSDYRFVVSGSNVISLPKPWWQGGHGEGFDVLSNVETLQFSATSISTPTSGASFDWLQYTASYPDLVGAFGLDASAALNHFIQNGALEGRMPTFRPLDYIASYPDLVAAFDTNADLGVKHFITNGLAEGRHVGFDSLDYLASYRDLAMAFGSDTDAAARHYIQHGLFEGRGILRHIGIDNGLDYIASYPDLMAAFGVNAQAGVTHYLQNGEYEGRTQKFNSLDYLASYPDLVDAFGTDAELGTQHYIEHGYGEGRTQSFNGLDYIASYPDLVRAFGINHDAGTLHYIEHGRDEGRVQSFDGLRYIASYGDLIRAFGTNHDAGTLHYIEHGLDEGRVQSFDPAHYLASYPDLQNAFHGNLELATQHYITNGYYEGRHT